MAHVDDLLVVLDQRREVENRIGSFKQMFEVKKEKFQMSSFGMTVCNTRKTLISKHHQMIDRMRNLFSMEDCYPVELPIQPGTNLWLAD